MTSISYYEARTHFSELLDQVARGKKILITRRGRPAALLTPPPIEDQKDIKQIIEEMRALRRGNMLGKGVSIRDLIEEGRRF
jgi:prevent-host-death family protein